MAQPSSAGVATRSCSLTDKVPAEIRNSIYELAFSSDDDTDVIELLEAQPLSKNLLLTSRQVYLEAKGVYKHVYRKYWSTTKFSSTYCKFRSATYVHSCLRANAKLAAMRRDDLENISSLTIRSSESGRVAYDLLGTGGPWWVNNRHPEYKYYVACGPACPHNHTAWFRDEAHARAAQASTRTAGTQKAMKGQILDFVL